MQHKKKFLAIVSGLCVVSMCLPWVKPMSEAHAMTVETSSEQSTQTESTSETVETMPTNPPAERQYEEDVADPNNRVLNHSFEGNSNIGNKAESSWGVWYATAGGSVRVSSEVSKFGPKSLEISHPTLARTAINQEVPIEGGAPLTIRFWMKTEEVSNQAFLRFKWRYEDETTDRYPKYGAFERATGTTDWTLYEDTLTAPANAKAILLDFFLGDTNTTGTMWIDNVQVIQEVTVPTETTTETTTAPSTESTTTVPGEETTATTPDASTETPAREYEPYVENPKNFALNPSFEITEAPSGSWVDAKASDWNVWQAYGSGQVSVTDQESKFGPRSVQIVHTEKARTSVNQNIFNLGSFSDVKIGMWLKTENVDTTAFVRYQIFDSNNKRIGAVQYGQFKQMTGTTDWTYVSTTFTTPADTTRVSLEVFLGNTGQEATGTLWIDEVVVEAVIPTVDFSLDNSQETLDIALGESMQIPYTFEPFNASDQSMEWTSSNPESISVDAQGVVTAHKVGIAAIYAKSLELGKSDYVYVQSGMNHSLNIPNVSKRLNENSSASGALALGDLDPQTLNMSILVAPEKGTASIDAAGNWTYTPEEYYSGKDHFKIAVFNLEGGISVVDVDLQIDTIFGEEFAALRTRYFQYLTGSTPGMIVNWQDADVKAYTDNLLEIANSRWQTMDRTENRVSLWPEMSNTASSWNVVWQYEELQKMALAYQMPVPGSSLYQNADLKAAIIDGLEWLHVNRFNTSQDPTAFNWFHWQISGPMALLDSLVLMYDDLDPALVDSYMETLDHMIPHAGYKQYTPNIDVQTGMNLTNRVWNVMLRGIVGQNSARLREAVQALSPVFDYVTSGDGFYEDGSFIQHGHLAYIGSYGEGLLNTIGKIFYLVDGSTFDITDPDRVNVWNWIEDSYIPAIHKGATLNMLRGRDFGKQDHEAGRRIIISMARLVEMMPEDLAQESASWIRYWVEEDTSFDNYYATTQLGLSDLVQLKTIVQNAVEIVPELLHYSHIYNAQDNVIHIRPDFTYAIQMFSPDITAFEYGNGANADGWYTSAGMSYLYNNDLTQFTNIERTIDFFRLVGTTTDHAKGNLIGWHKYPNPRLWVGGSTIDDLYSSVGMDFSMSETTGSSLEGKKSWFLFDDKIVALGAGITSAEEARVETIVENRRIHSQEDYALTVDGKVLTTAEKQDSIVSKARWAHISGNTESGSDIGYYFPESTDIDVQTLDAAGKYNIFPNADTTLYDGNKITRQEGDHVNLATRSNGPSYNNASVIKFNLEGFEDGFESAIFRLYIAGLGQVQEYNNYAAVVSNDWDEMTLTGEQFKFFPLSERTWVLSEPFAEWTISKDKTRTDVYHEKEWVEIDVTAVLNQAIANGETEISIGLFSDDLEQGGRNSNDVVYYASRNNTNTSLRPNILYATAETTHKYQSIAINHGVRPENAGYAYAVVPNKTASEMAAFAENPGFIVVENNEKVQAVWDEDSQVLGVNVWVAEEVVLDLPFLQTGVQVPQLRIQGPASFTIRRVDNALRIAVSDPTQTNVSLQFAYEDLHGLWNVASSNERVVSVQNNGTHTFTVNTEGMKGESVEFSLNQNEKIARKAAKELEKVENTIQKAEEKAAKEAEKAAKKAAKELEKPNRKPNPKSKGTP